jgi:hypothetical protein
MNDLKVVRWTGAFGVAAGVLLLVASPLYLIGTPPSLGDEALFSECVTRSNTTLITTKLVDMGYLVFGGVKRDMLLETTPGRAFSCFVTSRKHHDILGFKLDLTEEGFIESYRKLPVA